MSTTCVYPLPTEEAFRLAKAAGFDGIEIMVTRDPITQDSAALSALAAKYELPIISIHAPVLLLTHFVWGRDPQIKLQKSAELASALGATSVVVHPPFRWQARYATDFLKIVRDISTETGVEIAVENMFPWKVRGASVEAYAPGPDPRVMDCDAVTLDFSHAALSGFDSLQMAIELGERLRHVHLCDGAGSMEDGKIFDEHLLPGDGGQPVAEVLSMLAKGNWDGSVVAEVNLHKYKGSAAKLELLKQTVDFARTHMDVAVVA
jgi:sugar phosphate isomerase/epimerase